MAHPVNIAGFTAPPSTRRWNKQAPKVDAAQPLGIDDLLGPADVALSGESYQPRPSRQRSKSVDERNSIEVINDTTEESASRRRAPRRTKSLATPTISSDGPSRRSPHGSVILGDEDPPSSIIRSKLRSDPELARALLISKQEEEERRANANKENLPYDMEPETNEVVTPGVSSAAIEMNEPGEVVIPVTKRGRGRPKGTTRKLQLPAEVPETQPLKPKAPHTSTVQERLGGSGNESVVQDICGRAAVDVEQNVGDEVPVGLISPPQKGRKRKRTASKAIDEEVPIPTEQESMEIPQTIREIAASAVVVPPAPGRAATRGRKRAKTMPRLGRKVVEVSDTEDNLDVEDLSMLVAPHLMSAQAVLTPTISPDRQTTPFLSPLADSAPNTTPPKDIPPEAAQVQTPKKKELSKGPDKHSPLTKGRTHRVGLSKRQRIPALLKIFRK